MLRIRLRPLFPQGLLDDEILELSQTAVGGLELRFPGQGYAFACRPARALLR